MSDFDVMLEKKKAERQASRRKRKDVDIINDNDDLIADMVQKMKVAAEVMYSPLRVFKKRNFILLGWIKSFAIFW